MRCIAGERSFVMRGRNYTVSFAAAIAVLGALVSSAALERWSNFYNGRIHGAGVLEDSQGNRHQGRVRYLRRKRRWRSGCCGKIGYDVVSPPRIFLRARSAIFSKTRQSKLPKSRQRVPSNPTPCRFRIGQQFWRQLHVGTHRHRLHVKPCRKFWRARSQ